MAAIVRLRCMPLVLALGLALVLGSSSDAQHHGGGGRGRGNYDAGLGGGGLVGGLGFGVPIALPYGYGCGSTIGYPYPYYASAPAPLAMAGPGTFAPLVPPNAMNNARGGLMLGPMPPGMAANPPAPARRPNPDRAKEQVEIGDRSFRQGYTKRAEEKYKIAAKADPSAPMPHVHLAQIEIVRGDYAAAADHLRDAVTVAPGNNWLLNAPDVEKMYREPADFAKRLALLESHLQANLNDRDAWFVLGAEYYLSGRTRQAADIFRRLSDRKADEALAAFTDASQPRAEAPAAGRALN